MRMMECLFDGAGPCAGDAQASARARLIGRCVKGSGAALDGGALRPPSFPQVIIQICSVFFFFFSPLAPQQMNGTHKKNKISKKYIYIALHNNSIPWARTRNNGPFSASCAFPLNTPVDVTSAPLTMGSARSKRAWLVATTCSVVAFIFVVIFKDDILPCRPPFAIVFLTVMHFFPFFLISLHLLPSPLFSPSCGSLMKRSPLNWKTVIKMRWVLFTSVHGGTNSTELVNQKLII